MSDNIELLSDPFNFAVVQLKDRNYPGVVFQGDSLHSLIQRFSQINKLIEEQNLDELQAEVADIQEYLSEILLQYEAICRKNNIELPYSKK